MPSRKPNRRARPAPAPASCRRARRHHPRQWRFDLDFRQRQVAGRLVAEQGADLAEQFAEDFGRACLVAQQRQFVLHQGMIDDGDAFHESSDSRWSILAEGSFQTSQDRAVADDFDGRRAVRAHFTRNFAPGGPGAAFEQCAERKDCESILSRDARAPPPARSSRATVRARHSTTKGEMTRLAAGRRHRLAKRERRRCPEIARHCDIRQGQ